MIAGTGTHEETVKRSLRFAMICSEENIESVQRDPTPPELVRVERYRSSYHERFARWPHGMHYIDLGAEETTPVWFPPVD